MTNNPLAELLGIPGVAERHHPIVREPEAVSTEWCSERLGTDLIRFLERLDSDVADELVRRVEESKQ
jgi:hypothetical protein